MELGPLLVHGVSFRCGAAGRHRELEAKVCDSALFLSQVCGSAPTTIPSAPIHILSHAQIRIYFHFQEMSRRAGASNGGVEKEYTKSSDETRMSLFAEPCGRSTDKPCSSGEAGEIASNRKRTFLHDTVR